MSFQNFNEKSSKLPGKYSIPWGGLYVAYLKGKIGYKYIILDTLPTMKSAQALYKKLGFIEIEPYYNNPIEGAAYLSIEIS